MHQTSKIALAMLIGLAAATAQATPTVDKVTLSPAGGAKVGDKVTATIEFANAGEGICGLEVETGDGRREVFKIKPDTKLPLVFEHVYKTPGEMKFRAAGDKVENAFGCIGKQIVMYKVEAAPAAAAKPAAGACPADWALKGKVAKNGAFTCVPAKGVKNPAKPEKGLECPAGTGYFTKGKTLGCEAN